jgi:hypothetical protein
MFLAIPSTASALIALATARTVPEQDPVATSPAPVAADTWEFAGSVYYSRPPGDAGDRLTGVLYADRGRLHLEGRYNYEDLETASVFAGYRFPIEGELSGGVTPMLGGVFGDTDGVAPGVEASLDWRRLAWYVEAEYVFDAHDSGDDFFYSWSTLLYGITDNLRAGLVLERSKLVETSWDVNPGLALEFKVRNMGFSVYAYDIGTDDFYAVVAFQYAP